MTAVEVIANLHVGNDRFPQVVRTLDELLAWPLPHVPLYQPVDVAEGVGQAESFFDIGSGSARLTGEVDEVVNVKGFTHIQVFKHTEGG